MKKTYLKPTSLTVKIVPQNMIALSNTDKAAVKGGMVYGRSAEFSDWSEDEE